MNAAQSLSLARSRASRSGVSGEAAVAALNTYAAKHGRALLHKVPTPTRRVRKGLHWELIYVARSTVDFVGLLLDGTARLIALEVKTCTASKSFAMREVEPHQRDYLDAVHAAGGVALLAVVTRHPIPVLLPYGQVSLYRWAEVRDLPRLSASALLAARLPGPEAYPYPSANPRPENETT